MKFILFASIAFIVVHLSSAQDQAQVPPDAQDLHSKYLNADKTILKPVENLKQNYINHLQQLLKKNQQSGNLEAALEIKTEIDSSLEGKINEKAPAYQNLLKAKNLYSQAREANLRKLASERIRVLDIYRSQLEKQTKLLTKSGKLKEAKEVSEFSASLIEKRNELEQVNAFAQVDQKGNIDWASIVADIKAKKTKKTEVAANAKESNYEVMSEEDNPGLLVGFRLGMSKMRDSSGKEHRMVRGFQPIFRNSTGKETTSDSNIGFKNPISYKRIVARANPEIRSC